MRVKLEKKKKIPKTIIIKIILRRLRVRIRIGPNSMRSLTSFNSGIGLPVYIQSGKKKFENQREGNALGIGRIDMKRSLG